MIRKNYKNYKKPLRKYNFRKFTREASTSEQVRPIFISNTKEEGEQDVLQQHQEGPSQQKEHTHEQIL